jgi:predicted PurR-regulated permease PerM
LQKETAVDVFEFAQCLQVLDGILVAAVIGAMLFYMAYPEVKRVARRVLVKASDRPKNRRGYRG